MKEKILRFSRENREFSVTLNKRISEYFKQNKKNRYGNSEMVFKTFFMLLLYFGSYLLIVTNVVESIPLLLVMVILMSIGAAGIGLSVMHDANHGAYSNKKSVNHLIGRSMELLGGSSFNWKVQHNIMHHTYTNVHEADEDIDPRGVLRFSPHTRWKKIHRYQYIYAWFLYGLMTIVWLFYKDFHRLARYGKLGMISRQKSNNWKEWSILIGSKLIYIGYVFLIPLLTTSLAWWQIIIGVVIMQYCTGFILAIIFQPAHVIDTAEFPLPDEANELEHNWAVHQLYTTTNFGNKSRIFSWYVGGLNFQIEHHLFPNICHVHYRKIAPIVKETAREFGLPYKSSKTFLGALNGHMKQLKQLGKKPVPAY